VSANGNGPSRLQLWRARHTPVVRAEARQRREAGRAPRPAPLPGDWLVRWATVLAVVAVAGVAAYVSYWHAVDVVTRHGEQGVKGHLYPVVIDGIIVAASMVVLDSARHREDAPKLAWSMLFAGISVTLAANVTYGVSFGLAGALWGAWPALAFVGCYELLMMLVRASARRAGTGNASTAFVALPNAAEVAAEASLRATIAVGNPWTTNQLQTQFRLTRAEATNLRTRVLAGSNGHAPNPTTP
jgi:Protein of unknown function (DUF2637)